MNANAEFRKSGLLAVWRNLTTEPLWKYEELPPLLLSQLTKLDLLEASDSELSRAIWFWLRQPKFMFHGRAALMIVALCVLISLSIALLNWSGISISKRNAEVMILLVEVAVEIYGIGYRFKFLRWRRDYERSIDRLIRRAHPEV